MSDYTPGAEEGWREWLHNMLEDAAVESFDRMIAQVRAEAIREYVAAARENPHTYYWPPSGVLDDAEQWADEIEKGTI